MQFKGNIFKFGIGWRGRGKNAFLIKNWPYLGDVEI